MTYLYATLEIYLFFKMKFKNLLSGRKGTIKSLSSSSQFIYILSIVILILLIFLHIHLIHIYFKERKMSDKRHEIEMIQVKIRLEPQSLKLQIPINWEINKIKCILISLVPKFQFDHFQLKLPQETRLLHGSTTIKNLIDKIYQKSIKQIELVFIRTAAIEKFEEYYERKMKKLLKRVNENQFQPILNPNYYLLNRYYCENDSIQIDKDLSIEQKNFLINQNLLNMINQFHGNHNINHQPNLNQVNNQNLNQNEQNQLQGNWLTRLVIKVFQIFTLVMIFQQIKSNATFSHIIFVCLLIFCYFLVDYIIKYQKEKKIELKKGKKNEKKPQIQQKSQIQKKDKQSDEKQPIKCKKPFMVQLYIKYRVFLLQLIFLVVQSFLTFILSIFPNWSVEHHLDINQQLFDTLEDYIAKYDSNTETKQENFLSHTNDESSRKNFEEREKDVEQ